MKVLRFNKSNQPLFIKIILFLLFFMPTFVMGLTADFVGSPTSGTSPLQVTFTDQSQGQVFSWAWSFPGGSPSVAPGAGPHTVTYNNPGSYNVTLIVWGSPTLLPQPSDTLTRYGYITVYQPEPLKDFGDAPDVPDDTTKNYRTLLVNDGAYHIITDNIYLGSTVDAESDGQPNETATGDDIEGDDEDGVKIPTLVIGDSAEFEITVVGNGFLNGWIDFNRDGDWDEVNEHIFNAVPLITGTHTIGSTITETAIAGTRFARFRYGSEFDLDSFGGAIDGEVEDIMIELKIINACIQDSLALVALYNSTDGPNWTNDANWLTGSVTTWYGIEAYVYQ